MTDSERRLQEDMEARAANPPANMTPKQAAEHAELVRYLANKKRLANGASGWNVVKKTKLIPPGSV